MFLLALMLLPAMFLVFLMMTFYAFWPVFLLGLVAAVLLKLVFRRR